MTSLSATTMPERDGADTSVGDVPMDRLHAVFDSMFDGVWMVAPNGRTTYANIAMAHMLAVSLTDLNGRTLNDFLDSSLWPAADAFLVRQQSVPGERIELRFRRADGRELDGLLAASSITASDGTFVGTMLNFSDVTGKRALEAQHAQEQKMRAIGEFAGGLAHDFNNLLTAIRGNAELAHAESAVGSSVRADLDEVIKSADRASAITRKLLAYTRRQVLEPVLVDPSSAIGDMIPMLSTLVGDDVAVILHVSPRHGWINVDPVQFEQVITNLIVNARDAMPGGGTLTLTVANVEESRSEQPEAGANGSKVRITVVDTGHGMDEATRLRAFDPFFTTKALGKGTGLGLATVFGIVTQSGGAIQVESTVDVGTTFTIDLPSEPQPGMIRRASPEPDAPVVAGVGVVLLVEDEDAVRAFTRRALERAGFTVLDSPGGVEAVRLSDGWAGEIDVLVTDVMLDGIRGPEVVRRLRTTRPTVGVIYVSGYPEELLNGAATGSYDAFLAKPYTADVLTRAVSRVIAARPQGRRPHA